MPAPPVSPVARRPRTTKYAPLLFVLFSSTRCDFPADSPYAPSGGGDVAPLHVVRSVPASGAVDVALGATLAVYLSDYPDPATLFPFGSITLHSGGVNFDYAARVDLIDQAVLVQPRAAMAPDTEYTLVLHPSLRGLSGATLAANATVTFRTGKTLGTALPGPTARTLAVDVQPLLDTCAYTGCHASSGPAGGLALDGTAASRSLVGVLSSERSGLARVQPVDPASSYLLRKLLGTPDIVPSPMPFGNPWPADRIRLVSDWIETGAK